MIRALLATLVLLYSVPAALCEPQVETEQVTIVGPQTGTMAPEFSALTPSGVPVELSDISGVSGAVLVFSRSLDWCPYCKKQSIELIDATAPLDEAGWTLSLITYDSPEILSAYGKSKEISYTLLSDTGSAMIDAFGLRNHDVPEGSRYDGIPHPAIVFIGKDGVIKAVLREDGYKDRPPVEAVLETAQSISSD